MKNPVFKKLTSAANKFHWNADLEAEFMKAKQLLDERVALSPLDTFLELNLHVDTSKEGFCYVLTQPYQEDIDLDVNKKRRHIVAMGSTGLNSAQSRYSPVELETLGVVHAVTKLDYFTRGTPKLDIHSNCSALGPLFTKGIDEIKTAEDAREDNGLCNKCLSLSWNNK